MLCDILPLGGIYYLCDVICATYYLCGLTCVTCSLCGVTYVV